MTEPTRIVNYIAGYSLEPNHFYNPAEFEKRAKRLRIRTELDAIERKNVGLRDSRGMNEHFLRVKYRNNQ